MMDAPYIVDAEKNGIPHPATMECPNCGQECKTLFVNKVDLTVFGCDKCIREMSVDEWRE